MTASPLIAGSLYREIRERILAGFYLPGKVLRQQDIAEQFDTSRVPLREAFSKLEAEGLLIQRPQRGYAVVSLEPAEIAEIFDLRTVMERHAGQIATRLQKAGDAQALEAIFHQQLSLVPSDKDTVALWCQVNRQFQDRLFECCNRPRLTLMLQQLRDQLEPYLRLEISLTHDVGETLRDHGEILSAFRSGDADLVGELCAVHCGRTSKKLLENMPLLISALSKA